MPRIASINPASLATPIGFAHGVASSGGRLLWLAGQNGMDDQGRIVAPGDIVAQTDLALANILAVVAAAGGRPSDVVKLHFYVSDLAAYRGNRRALGQVWRRHFDRWYPAMMLLGVSGFFEPEALVEIDGYAVLPEPAQPAALAAELGDDDSVESDGGPSEARP
ncbi:MAG: RidA family protein [Caldilineae bacterium]|nr:RidA family protein [Chloroflexota bacterium]MCB9175761.1 RidA family protein [Caldilineae bacterium]